MTCLPSRYTGDFSTGFGDIPFDFNPFSGI